MKRRLCNENKVNLIEVPYSVKIEDIRPFLINALEKLGYNI